LLEKYWGISVVCVTTFFALLMIVSATYGGLGVGIENGRFVMRQGFAHVEVNPLIGYVLFGLIWSALLSGVAAFVTTIMVVFRHGSCRVEVVLGEKLRNYGIAIRLAQVFVAVAVLVWILW
jgi:hypothetical protein